MDNTTNIWIIKMNGVNYIQSLDSTIENLELDNTKTQYKSDTDKAVKVIQDIEKHIGNTLPIDLKINKNNVNQLEKLRTRICKISEISSKKNLEHNINKYCKNVLEKIDLITDYYFAVDSHYKTSLKIKITNRLRSDIVESNLNWDKIKNDPLNHPEWLEFKSKFSKHLTEEETEYIWKKLISTIIQIKDHIANNRPYKHIDSYKEIAEILSKKGLLTPGKDKKAAALWSGGYDVSLFAQKNGFATLATTIAGSILNELVLANQWEIITNLWSELSNKYIENITKEVHIFFRVHDPLSILEKVEIPSLLSKKNINFIFHPLYNPANDNDPLKMEEVEINLSAKPHIALKNFLVETCKKQLKIDGNYDLYKKNLLAINIMKLD